MTQCELATLMQEKLDLKIAIIDNGFLGMVRQWQEFFYDKRYAATPLLSPDFVKLAGAYGIPAHRVDARADVIPTVERVRNQPGPASSTSSSRPRKRSTRWSRPAPTSTR
jgi:acetolactate synthase-1/2/3 large subunit